MNELSKEIITIIAPAIDIMAESCVKKNCKKLGLSPETLTKKESTKLFPEIEKAVEFFAVNSSVRRETISKLRKFAEG